MNSQPTYKQCCRAVFIWMPCYVEDHKNIKRYTHQLLVKNARYKIYTSRSIRDCFLSKPCTLGIHYALQQLTNYFDASVDIVEASICCHGISFLPTIKQKVLWSVQVTVTIQQMCNIKTANAHVNQIQNNDFLTISDGNSKIHAAIYKQRQRLPFSKI